jgi:hypothetical protein
MCRRFEETRQFAPFTAQHVSVLRQRHVGQLFANKVG